MGWHVSRGLVMWHVLQDPDREGGMPPCTPDPIYRVTSPLFPPKPHPWNNITPGSFAMGMASPLLLHS